MYIHQLDNWPHFFWDQTRLAPQLLQIRHQQGRLSGGMESLGFSLREETILNTLTSDVVKSSEIEGEILDQSQVRSSVAQHLGIEIGLHHAIDRNVEGVVEMMLDATQQFEQPLTKERLWNWHKLLFPVGYRDFKKIRIGAWRTGRVQVISGHRDREVLHFEAPAAEKVEHDMELFLDWMNHEDVLDPVLKAAIAHLWFLTIHPFDDGNGRIGRAIADFLLARSEKSSHRFYSLSTQIQKERKGYYLILEKTQKGGLDLTVWIEWFFSCLERSIEEALSHLEAILYKGRFWERLAEISLNERQKKMINLLLEGFEGKFTTSKWAKVAKCSQDTAYRDILDLLDKSIIMKNSEGGRSTSYSLIIYS